MSFLSPILRRLFGRLPHAFPERVPPLPICTLTFAGGRLARIGGTLPGKAGQDLSPGLGWEECAAQVAPADAALNEALGLLLREGLPFTRHAVVPGLGMTRISGRTAGLSVVLELAVPDPGERTLATQLADANGRLAELRHMRERAEASPLASFETDGQGTVLWRNRAAAALLRGLPPDAIAELVAAGAAAPQRLPPAGGPGERWVRLTTSPGCDGRRLHHVEDISASRKAEVALRGLMDTLTDTFAHLDAGIAIFDGSGRKLVLFNPALAALTGLDPADLAAAPSLREFLGALRQRRMIPEPADFTLWRRRLIERLTDHSDTPYREDWTLPSGQILRVSARPHRGGALAFVFEDISAQVMLERRHRSEIELGHAVIDRLEEGAAVFCASGQIVFANRAFSRAIGFDPFAGLLGGGLDALIAAVSPEFGPAEAWERFREYALSGNREERWSTIVGQGTGNRVLLRASPFPDGATLLCVLPAHHATPAPEAPATADPGPRTAGGAR